MMNNLKDKESLRQSFEKNGHITIPNFLKNDFAEEIYTHINNNNEQEDAKLWKKNILIDDKLISLSENSDDDKKEKISKLRNIAQYKANKEHEFSFCYSIKKYHDDQCNCFTCDAIRRIFYTPEFLQMIRDVTGIVISDINEIFYSYFKEEDFLTLHTDYDKGLITFTLNLTKNWKPYYGGLLHLVDQDDNSNIKRIIVPQFNQITLIKIPPITGFPHFVSPVVPYCPESRYSITGWFY